MAVFRYSNPPVIHWGAGSLARLGEELERLEAKRVAIVTTRSLLTARSAVSGAELIGNLREAMGGATSPVTFQIGQHAPLAEVEAAIARAAESGVDGIVSFGCAVVTVSARKLKWSPSIAISFAPPTKLPRKP